MRTPPFAKALALGAALSFAAPVSLLVAAPAQAVDGGGEHGGDSHGDDHGGDAHGGDHGDGHGDGHGGAHVIDPLADDNHNGTINFLDGEDEHYANSWGHPVALQWVWHAINLAILVGALVWFGRKPIGAAIRDRSLGIRKELEDASELEQDARGRFEELEQRLSGFEDEVASMKAEARKQAEAEKAEAIQRGQDSAARIAASAERAIRDETARATRALRAEAVELAVKLAEDTLRKEVASTDRERLARAFLDSLQADAGGTHG